jgi:hypothetical protein
MARWPDERGSDPAGQFTIVLSGWRDLNSRPLVLGQHGATLCGNVRKSALTCENVNLACARPCADEEPFAAFCPNN